MAALHLFFTVRKYRLKQKHARLLQAISGAFLLALGFAIVVHPTPLMFE
jgi:hypothetical protein